MKVDKEKKIRKITPVGEAKWAHLHTPKAPFLENGRPKGEPKYQVDIIFDPKEAVWDKWSADLLEAIRQMPDQIDKKTGETIRKQSPIKRELDQNDQPTGRFYVTVKTSDKFKPGVFDKHGTPLNETTLVGNGSKIRVAYIENAYTAFGGGINLYLNAVQVLELVEYSSQSATSYGFDIEPITEPSELEPF